MWIRNSQWPYYLDKKGRVADLRDSKVPGDGLAPVPTVHQEQSLTEFRMFGGPPSAPSSLPP